MRVVAAIWEEHCSECAMPLCFHSCALFERGWHGRCVRADGFEESVLGTGTVRLRRWGKLELMYHGTMVGSRLAVALGRANLRARWLWRLLGKFHRALRWRLLAALGKRGTPNRWRLRLRSERDELLCAVVAYEDGRELMRAALALKAGVETAFELQLPRVQNRALFQLFAQDGEATEKIEIIENSICDEGAPTLKCVAWDLDGVVWDGTLSEGDDVQVRAGVLETILALDRRGVVSSICSKNDEPVALAKLKELGLSDWFVFPQVNWGPKSESLKNLAREMNIGLDSIAFVDDREENRAEVRTNAPQVRVFDENEALTLADSLPGDGLGGERRRMYLAEMARRDAARDFGGDTANFYAQSGLEIELLSVEGERAERCFELINRTNQLTISGRRYGRSEFEALLGSSQSRAVRVRDRYGDYGIVGFVAWNLERVIELVFSCRVARRGVERKVLESLPKGLQIEAAVTERNAPIREIIGAWREETAE